MDYNTSQAKLKLPEYGRLVQQMVEHAVAIENRAERQAYAETIIAVMGNLFPQMRNVPDFKHKLWDHLAYISGYRLDIDYPCEIEKRETGPQPAHLSYPGKPIRYRHYGHLLEKLIQKLAEMPAGPERDELTRIVAYRMKYDLAEWKGDGIEDAKVSEDLARYTNGAIHPDFTYAPLGMPVLGPSENGGGNRSRKGRRNYSN